MRFKKVSIFKSNKHACFGPAMIYDFTPELIMCEMHIGPK